MDLQTALTVVALTYPTPDRGEVPEARAERLERVSDSVVAAAERATCRPPWDEVDAPCRRLWPGSTVELAAVVWSLGYLESGMAEWVHAGRCRVEIGECDAQVYRGILIATAISPWQLKQTLYTAEAWDELEGVGEWSTFQAAWSATRVVAAARVSCSRWRPDVPWLPATIAGYATGNGCAWPRAEKRAAFIVRVESQIRSRLGT